jgi:flagellar motor component MotA
MATHCEQLAGELKVLEELLRQTSTEHKRREIIERIDQVKAEQQKHGCLETEESR